MFLGDIAEHRMLVDSAMIEHHIEIADERCR